jgi:hypothetical protein
VPAIGLRRSGFRSCLAIDETLAKTHAETMPYRSLFLFGFLAVGCGGATTDQRVVKTAASRWQCPADQIEIRKLSGDMYRVAGCDREADYACTNEDSNPGGQCLRVSGT